MERFMWKTNGMANEKNIVSGAKYRFTVLTPRMIRLEFCEEGIFEDRASQIVFHRDFSPVKFSLDKDGDTLILKTEYLTLTYKENASFSEETLQIRLDKFNNKVWKYGENCRNLKGTISTLDKANGEVPLGDGILSKDGCTFFDDSNTAVLTESGWFDVRKSSSTDVYFLGYGHDYLACVADFYKLTDVPPFLPKYALGNWWSRFYKYTQDEYCNLMKRFKEEKLPFSVAVVDMDWHKEGWTGYSWNTELFPDYKAFLKFLKECNLHVSLNLHPANGVAAHEDMYEEMAIACGYDPESKKTVKLDCLNPDFMANYFDILHHPYEKDGVDFWWMDWQQGKDYWWIHDEDHPNSELEIIDPLWLLNHLHIIDISRNGKRPMFFSRYAGLGSHRYPVGFSGDTIITWDSLKFQPYFTATASNVGYSWWSHDIGGHTCGYRDDELQVRWVQLGVFSPINRLHSSNSPFDGKEPWNLGLEAEKIVGDYLRLRHKLLPYLYTMNYRSHTKLLPMIQPMYYSHPECEEAYQVPNQYWFGSELIVSPITQGNDKVAMLGQTEVWLPEGYWIDFFNGALYKGGKKIKVSRPLSQMPIFAKAGAIVPMNMHSEDNTLENTKDIEICVFAGGNNTFTLYEDAGDGADYLNEKFATTDFSLAWNDNKAEFSISNVSGDASLVPNDRNYKIKFVGFSAGNCINVYKDGKACDFTQSYDKKSSTITVDLKDISTLSQVNITVEGNSIVTDNSNIRERIFDVLLHSQMSYKKKQSIWEFVTSERHEYYKEIYWECTEKEHRVILEALEELESLI